MECIIPKIFSKMTQDVVFFHVVDVVVDFVVVIDVVAVVFVLLLWIPDLRMGQLYFRNYKPPYGNINLRKNDMSLPFSLSLSTLRRLDR